ncbi:flagellar hook assembly protein FlgD [Uliginosibacterium sp. 31-16]|uniref:flagellar hook assembly protein FlgD n=1 Tax=Uliginosibacterium sp. 31-16 TaxID=3068315 RepID=UPI00273F0645|nr:flagellar hook assembly protein FlgD [Uliginosibacterium sp. 31-16]MDP5240622.1 flagellar hook assembly protein FlgD [Uliginosibacterium sp. 31-16]
MTTTSTVNSAAQDIYASLNGSSATKTTTTVEDQQNRFLKLLTTQLKNQDPLNPMDNAQTTSQLAQISTVDGITQLNATLKTLMGSMQSSEALQAATLVGHAVLVPGTGMQVISGQAAGGVELESAADKVSVTITDKNGLEIKRIDLGALTAGTHEFVWDGKNESGTAVADGMYKVSVTAYKGDTKVTASTLQLASVNSVITGGSEIQVDVGSLGRVSMGDIKLIL